MQKLMWLTPEHPPPKKKGKAAATSVGDEDMEGEVDGAALERDDASLPLERG